MILYAVINLFFLLMYTLIYKFTKKKKPLKRAFLTMLCGIMCLAVVDITGIFTGIYLPVSPLSVTISSCAGIPGVATMIVVRWIL